MTSSPGSQPFSWNFPEGIGGIKDVRSLYSAVLARRFGFLRFRGTFPAAISAASAARLDTCFLGSSKSQASL
jgi:hypothetical protein